MSERVYNVLFLCTGNSARSIMAEALLRARGGGRFRAFSAGSQPKDEVNPYALDMLQTAGLPTDGLRSKSWEEFAAADAPHMDFVFTVCDSAANESCPIWPGQAMKSHWGIDDPAAEEGGDFEKRRAFATAFRYLRNRIDQFVAIPVERLDKLAINAALKEIGEMEGATSQAAAQP